jgi:hypothetical protein
MNVRFKRHESFDNCSEVEEAFTQRDIRKPKTIGRFAHGLILKMGCERIRRVRLHDLERIFQQRKLFPTSTQRPMYSLLTRLIVPQFLRDALVFMVLDGQAELSFSQDWFSPQKRLQALLFGLAKFFKDLIVSLAPTPA